MCYKQLRIVSNGKGFRVQALEEYTTIERGNWYRRDKEITKTRWTFLDKDGYLKRSLFYSFFTTIMTVSSKKAAIKWIKDKFGTEGLNKLKQPEEKWEEV